MNGNSGVVRKGAAMEYTERVLGGPVNEVEANLTVQGTATRIAIGNADRVAVVVINTGTIDVNVALTPVAVASGGIRLAASGGNMTLTLVDDFTLTSRELWAIGITGTSAVYVLEYVRFHVNKSDN